YCSVVCQRFKGIILDPKYLPWKKLYARYLRREEAAVRQVEVHIREEIVGADRPLGSMELIRYVATSSTVQKIKDDETAIALDRLARHAQYTAASQIVQRLFNAVATENAVDFQPNLGALVAAMILISDNVESMSKVIHLLTAQPAF